jgi:hypothetical protein
MTAPTTTKLSMPLRVRFVRWLGELDRPLLVCGLALFLILAAGTAANFLNNRTQAQPQAPIIIMASPQPTPSLPTLASSPASEAPVLQIAASSVRRFERAVRAYGAPSLDSGVGAIEPGRPYTMTLRQGTDWFEADVERSGRLWFLVAEVTGLADLPEAEPPVTEAAPQEPAVMVAAPAPAAVEPAAAPTVAPPPPTVAPPVATPSWMVLHVASTSTPTPNDFADSFQEPATNPFIGCVTAECRRQFGQDVDN